MGEILDRITILNSLENLSYSNLIIEAIAENLGDKRDLINSVKK